MENHDFMVDRRFLAYITLLSGNLLATRDFLIQNQDKTLFTSQFISEFIKRMEPLAELCVYSGEELIRDLSRSEVLKGVFDETHRS
jgi:hypothetical protein